MFSLQGPNGAKGELGEKVNTEYWTIL